MRFGIFFLDILIYFDIVEELKLILPIYFKYGNFFKILGFCLNVPKYDDGDVSKNSN